MKLFAKAQKFINSLWTGPELRSKLYTHPDNIPVVVFYKILKTNDTSLLNPLKVKLPKEVNLDEIWLDILDEYYSISNKRGYDSVISKLKRKELLRNKLITCYSAITVLRNEEDNVDALDALEYFKFKDKTAEEILRSLSIDKGKLELLDREVAKENKEEEVNFWRLVVNLETAVGDGYTIDVEKTTLAKWIELIKFVRDKQANIKKQWRNKKR